MMRGASGRPVIEAHRGDSANAPENTLAAFRAAVALPVLWIELDVHPTEDGTLVVIHDDTVDRTTDGSGAVCEMTIDALRALDAGSWFDARFAGEPIPTLAEVLDLVGPTGTRLNIEIKSPPPGLDVARPVVDLLRQAGKERDYVISSFDLSVLLEVQALAPEITLALIGHGPEILPLALQHRLPWIHAYHATLDEAIVAEAHANGLRVNAWTVDDSSTLTSWVAKGLDKLCTNRPAAMLAAAGR
jgi:glycerophosphoryl diester phosphodiesterase